MVWDEDKREKVIRERNIDFANILDIFDDPFAVDFQDLEHTTSDETRYKIIGITVYYGLITLVYTIADSQDRFITAWKSDEWKQTNMSKTENGNNLKTSPEAQARGLKRVNGDHRKHLKNLTLKDCKSRVNIMLDADIIEFFKEQASQKGSLPYQTQINQALRQFMENAKEPKGEVITMKMLDNPDFISVLAEKLKAA